METSESTYKDVYRVDLNGSRCRSSRALLALNVAEIAGVDALTVTDDDRLLVVGPHGSELYDAILGAVVRSGLDPASITVADASRVLDGTPLSLEDARRAGLVAAPKAPVRAEIEQVQRVSVSVTDGYDPDTIVVSAGIPSEIAFSEGHGCLGRVVFDSLGADANLEDGGAIVRLPALEPGIYPFRCGRDMVHGTLIVE